MGALSWRGAWHTALVFAGGAVLFWLATGWYADRAAAPHIRAQGDLRLALSRSCAALAEASPGAPCGWELVDVDRWERQPIEPQPAGGEAVGPAGAAGAEPISGTFQAASAGSARPAWAPRWIPAACEPWLAAMEAAGAKRGVDPLLVLLVGLVESGCGTADSADVRPGDGVIGSTAGARGFAQFMSATALEQLPRCGYELPAGAAGAALQEHVGRQLDDHELSIDLSACYLAFLIGRYGKEGGLGFYNGGGRGANPATRPGETVSYLRWITGMEAEARQERSATYEQWCRGGGHRWVLPGRGEGACGDGAE